MKTYLMNLFGLDPERMRHLIRMILTYVKERQDEGTPLERIEQELNGEIEKT